MARRLLVTRSSMPVAIDKTRKPRAASKARTTRAFTLVELAIVVTIVGVLSVIAVVGYRKLTLQAKISEAQNMISAVRIAQENYRTERGIFANIGGSYCPSKGDSQTKWAWTPACAAGGTSPTGSWRDLPVHSDGPVQFGYATIAGPPTAMPGLPPRLIDTTAANLALPWFVVLAQADLNGDGPSGATTQLVGSSFDNRINAINEGE